MGEQQTDTERRASEELRARRREAGVPDDAPVWALAFSGGGIRSATFCLGLAQALARNQVFQRFDYLSTVSGGGYIGSAIGRLYGPKTGAGAVSDGLASDSSVFLWWLRRNGRFLLPAGIGDGLRAGAAYLRGLLATQFEVAVICVLLSCIIMLPHLLLTAISDGWPLTTLAISPWWLGSAAAALVALSCVFAYWFTRDGEEQKSPLRALIGFAVCALGTLVVWHWLREAPSDSGAWQTLRRALQLAMAVLIAMDVGWLLALRRWSAPRVTRVAVTAWLSTALVAGLAMAAFGVLDLLSWMLASQLDRLSNLLLAGGAGGLVLLPIVRAAIPRLAQLPNAYGLAAAPERIASVIGLVLSALLMSSWLLFAQWLVYFGPGIGSPLLACDLALLLGPFADFSSAYGRWLVTVAVVVLYMLLTGRNAGQLNRASLYQLYRSRIARAYVSLGNSPDHGHDSGRFKTSPLRDKGVGSLSGLRKITEFVDGDDVALAQYRPQDHGGPVHLVSCCINQTIDDRTDAYNADRKGVALTVSSLGYETGHGWPVAPSASDQTELSQWVAISGSAFGSGMGSATRAGISALSFLSGMRLGYWWARDRCDGAFAKYSAICDEWFGSFPGLSGSRWYLSDGGHFDNTGVYALLKRKPAFIVLADCGADPGYVFEDVENLVRKARIDYGAEIEILDPASFPCDLHINAIRNRFGTADSIGPEPGEQYLLLARIRYAPEDTAGMRKTGTLLIVKPRRVDALPLDIAGYSDRDIKYPQQTTADQFFDEAQWESYCQLGKSLAAPLSAAVLQALPAVAAAASPARTATVASPSEGKPQGSSVGRRERLAVTVGKTVSAGAALSMLAAGWQVWQDARGSMLKSRAEELDTVRVLLSGSAPDKTLLKRIAEAGKPQDVFSGIIADLEQLGALHGDDVLQRARTKLVSGLQGQCALLDEDSAKIKSRCVLALSILDTPPLPRRTMLMGRYWDVLAAAPRQRPASTCARANGDGPFHLLVHEGNDPDLQQMKRLKDASAALGIHYIGSGSDGFEAGDGLGGSRMQPTVGTMLASDAADPCASELRAAIAPPSSSSPIVVPAEFASVQPMFAYASSTIQYWLPQRANAEMSAQSSGAADASMLAPKATGVPADHAIADHVPKVGNDSAATIPPERPATIYVQFQGATTRGQINDYRGALLSSLQQLDSSKGITVPAAERIATPFSAEVRYFNEQDQALANAVADKTNAYYGQSACEASFQPIKARLVDLKQKIPQRQIEVWIKPACSPPPQ